MSGGRRNPRAVPQRRARTRPTTAEQPTRITVRHPSDFIAVVPYLLGFHPEESVVCLLLHRGRTRLSMRVDLPPVGVAGDLAAQVLDLADQHGAEQVLVIGYSSDLNQARTVLTVLADELGPIQLLDALLVSAGRWWSLGCDSGCCPADGQPYDIAAHPLAAQAVYAGLTASAGRASLQAMTAGPPGPDRDELDLLRERLTHDVQDRSQQVRLTEMSRLVRRYLRKPWVLEDSECIRLALLCTDLVVRDLAWSMMTRRGADLHVGLWRQVVGRTVAPLEAAPLCLLGMAGWIGGNGALLNCCIERMESIALEYSMFDLLRDISERAIPPSLWDSMSRSMTAEIMAQAG